MHGIEDSKRAATLRAIWAAVLHAMRGNPPAVFWLATAAGHAHGNSTGIGTVHNKFIRFIAH